MNHPTLRRIASWLGLIIPIGLIIGLFWRTWRNDPEAIELLLNGPRSPWRLYACFGLVISSILVTFVRWHLLLRTLHIPIRLRDTMRLGFLGQLMNFISLGQVGGDVVKAFFIAKEHKERRAAAISSILVDRACGLYGLLIVASSALLISGVSAISPAIATIAKATYLLTAAGTIGCVIILTPAIAKSTWVLRLTEIPRFGTRFQRLLDAIQLFRDNRITLLAIGVLSLLVHILSAMGVYFAATGLYAETPSMADMFVANPIASVFAALPISPGGLGTYELAMDYMYNHLSPPSEQGRGIVVASCFRIATIMVAMIGVVFYWTHHREVAKALREAEAEIQQKQASERD